MNIAIMVRRTVARTVCGSATRWNRGATVTGPVEHAWWPSPSPPTPFLSRSAGEEGGIMPHTFPRPPAASTKGVAGESVAVAILRPRLSTIPRPQLPLSRSAGEGPGGRAARSADAGLGVRAARSAGAGSGVRAARSAGAGLGVRAARSAGAGSGVRAARTFPRPLSVPTKKAEEQGCERSRGDPASASCNDTESTNQFTPLPQCGRGAGGEGRPQRRSGVGGEGSP